MKKFFHNFLFFILLGSQFLSCTTFDKSELKNLNNGEVLKIGHGGSGFVSLIPFNPYPSNSRTSIRKALIDNNADGVEVDIHMTADEKFVLYHDQQLDSKTNLKGCIESMSYDSVISAEYKVGFPYDLFQSERLIGLEDLIKECQALEEFPFLHFDLRVHSSCFTDQENYEREKRVYRKLVEFLTRANVPAAKVVLISLRRSFIEYALEQQAPFLLSIEEYGTFEEGVKFAKENGIKYLTLKPNKLSKEKTNFAHEEGIQIITFGANSKRGNKKLLELNPDIIQTNNLSALHDLLK